MTSDKYLSNLEESNMKNRLTETETVVTAALENFKGWLVTSEEKKQLVKIQQEEERAQKLHNLAAGRMNDVITMVLKIDPIADWNSYSKLMERIAEESTMLSALSDYESKQIINTNYILRGKKFVGADL